jgi:hypothetical protein
MGIKTRRQRFNPSRSVKVLLASDKSSEDKIYELMRLLAWSLLERKTKQDRSYDVEMRRRELANDAGVYALAYLIHNERQKKRSRKLDSLMDSLDKIGGMLRIWYTDRSFDLFKDAREAHRDLRLVCDLVSFLCIHPPCSAQCGSLDAAKWFLSKESKRPTSEVSFSELDKIWNSYKDAAPYIFVFFPWLDKALVRQPNPSPTEFMAHLLKIATNQALLTRALSEAAYVANVLKQKKIRNVRTSDFIGIPPRKCRQMKLSGSDREILGGYDPQRLSKKDTEPYSAGCAQRVAAR